MTHHLDLSILAQPDDSTCGPTCLQAVYGFYGLELSLEEVIAGVRQLDTGGTLAVLLGQHALECDLQAELYTFDLQVFDPTWFQGPPGYLRERLAAQADIDKNPKIRLASRSYLRFLDLGGKVHFEDLTGRLLTSWLRRGVPILTGLSSTYLYREARERIGEGGRSVPDDLFGEPQGHFVVVSGYDSEQRRARVADPLHTNPYHPSHVYDVDLSRLVCAILLGTLTFDANMLVVYKPKKKGGAA